MGIEFDRTILFLENDDLFTRTLKRRMGMLLQSQPGNAEMVFVENVQDAYRAVRDRQRRSATGRILIICDGNLDDETGEDLLDQLRAELDPHRLLFVFLSDDERYKRIIDGQNVLFIYKQRWQDFDRQILAFLA